MRRTIVLLILMLIPLQLFSYYDTYQAAQGFPYPYTRPVPQYPIIPEHNDRYGSLTISVLSSALDMTRNESEDVLKLLEHTRRIGERRGSAYAEARSILDTLTDIYRDRSPFGREDDALRSLSSALDWIFTRRSCTWRELEDAVSRSFPEIIRALVRY